MNVDVGCGSLLKRDIIKDIHVNCDIAPLKSIENFVRCSITNMPFKDNTFIIAQARQVLEHLTMDDYWLGINELKRTSMTIIAGFPALIYAGATPEHKLIFFRNRMWRLRWFLKLPLLAVYFPYLRWVIKKIGNILKIFGEQIIVGTR